ncbi:hypothetical protein GCM10014715_39220 [Streptomyces spiralis]|uniref:Uncharacterized protein n=1 Tax=Streptomyces spiralis TaxID=66376 RepID=A0A918ZZA3_9ACTN|nr:hypothetical protein [Streptomyces spiralis]GHE80033.1 hypothetical protein GCM10014715_39220 [Streptomyces spiralis]
MAAASQRGSIVCTWCKHPRPADKIRYWDGKPQCTDEIRCMKRIPRKTSY